VDEDAKERYTRSGSIADAYDTSRDRTFEDVGDFR
jgi:hypothetical protein